MSLQFVKSIHERVKISVEELRQTFSTQNLRAQHFPRIVSTKVSFEAKYTKHGSAHEIVLVGDAQINKWFQNLVDENYSSAINGLIIWKSDLNLFGSLKDLKDNKAPAVKLCFSSTDSVESFSRYASRFVLVLNTSWDMSKFRICSFDPAEQSALPLTLNSLLSLLSLVVIERTAYCFVEMSTISHLIQFPVPIRGPAEKIFCASTTCPAFMSCVEERKSDILHDARFVDLLDTAVRHLSLIQKAFHPGSCYNETTRRQIIDIFECYTAAYLGTTCLIEENALEDKDTVAYIGNG